MTAYLNELFILPVGLTEEEQDALVYCLRNEERYIEDIDMTGWYVLDWFGLTHTTTFTQYFCYKEIMLAEIRWNNVHEKKAKLYVLQ